MIDSAPTVRRFAFHHRLGFVAVGAPTPLRSGPHSQKQMMLRRL